MAHKKKASGTQCKVPKTKKYGDKTYKVSTTTYKTKAQAQAAAKRHREGGKRKLARTFANPCGTGFKVAKRG